MTRGNNKSVDLAFRRKDEWVLEYLQAIVETKREMGIKTSLSYEIVRLIKNTLHDELKGAKLDAAILREKIDDFRKRATSDLSEMAREESGPGTESPT